MSKNLSRRRFIKNTAQAGLVLASVGAAGRTLAGPEKKGKPKLVIFSKHLQWLDYRGMAEKTVEIGFDGVDLTVRPKGHVLPERVEEDLPRAAEACRRAGTEIVMITTKIGDVAEPHTERILKTAGALGIKFYRMAWYKYDPAKSIEENLHEFAARMKDLAAMNEHYGIRGAYQNHAGARFGSAIWDLARVLQEVNSKWLGSQYDIRHATVEGTNVWPIGLELIAPWINTIDLKDATWSKKNGQWQPENVPLGQGFVDFEHFFKLVKKFDIRAPFSLHFEYDLGGANSGQREITIPGERVVAAMKRDLKVARQFLRVL